MRSVSEHQRLKIIRCTILSLSVSFMFFFSLHHTSNVLRDFMFSDPKSLVDWDDHVQIAVLLKGLNDDSDNGFNLRQKFRNFLKSLILHTKKYPLRLIFITDHRSVFQIEKEFEDALPPFPLENEVFSGKVPRFSKEYVQVGPILDLVDPWTQTMQLYFNHPKERFTYENKDPDNYAIVDMEFSDKYNHTIYYISPFYQRIFPKLTKLVVMDTDMEFRSDPAELYNEFEKFNMDQIFGCGNDLAPHYFSLLQGTGYFDLHPETKFGAPGRFQGLNVGVLLLRLDRLRKNKMFNQLLSSKGMANLVGTYGFYNTFLGAQDWFTLLSFDHPELVYPLDCKFNRQLNMDHNQEIWSDIFWKYHQCHNKTTFDNENAAIVHLNGNNTNFGDYQVTVELG